MWHSTPLNLKHKHFPHCLIKRWTKNTKQNKKKKKKLETNIHTHTHTHQCVHIVKTPASQSLYFGIRCSNPVQVMALWLDASSLPLNSPYFLLPPPRVPPSIPLIFLISPWLHYINSNFTQAVLFKWVPGVEQKVWGVEGERGGIQSSYPVQVILVRASWSVHNCSYPDPYSLSLSFRSGLLWVMATSGGRPAVWSCLKSSTVMWGQNSYVQGFWWQGWRPAPTCDGRGAICGFGGKGG